MDRKEIKFLFNYLENNQKYLTSLQYEFIISLKKHYNTTWVLTKNQVECLIEIKGSIPSRIQLKTAYVHESDKRPAQYSSYDNLLTYRPY
jgi:hypothetical protein